MAPRREALLRDLGDMRDLVTDLQLVDGTRGIISLFSARQPPEGGRLPAALFPETLPEGHRCPADLFRTRGRNRGQAARELLHGVAIIYGLWRNPNPGLDVNRAVRSSARNSGVKDRPPVATDLSTSGVGVCYQLLEGHAHIAVRVRQSMKFVRVPTES